jgi:AcrR family transcriptional regulator
MSARRTQAERRAATVQGLIDATISALAEVGYAKTSVREICRRAGVSQGGMFRHFPSRISMIAATVAEIGARHLARFEASFGAGVRDVDAMLAFVTEAARSDTHAAWHEVMVAARTDAELRPSVTTALQAFEAAVLGSVGRWLGVHNAEKADRLGVIVLSIMHLFDSEAVTTRIYPNPALVARRAAWLGELLRAELG